MCKYLNWFERVVSSVIIVDLDFDDVPPSGAVNIFYHCHLLCIACSGVGIAWCSMMDLIIIVYEIEP